MSDAEIQTAIERYLLARHDLLQLGRVRPGRIGGNDNIIGRIGEFIALRFLEGLGQHPTKVRGSSNQGYDLVEKQRQTQVKVITEENQKGRNVKLTEPWNQFVLIELGQHYKTVRIGILTKAKQEEALAENAGWSRTPNCQTHNVGSKGPNQQVRSCLSRK